MVCLSLGVAANDEKNGVYVMSAMLLKRPERHSTDAADRDPSFLPHSAVFIFIMKGQVIIWIS